MKMSEYFQDPRCKDNIYELKENGHIYKIDVKTREKEDVSYKTQFNMEWSDIPIYKVYEYILSRYVTSSFDEMKENGSLLKGAVDVKDIKKDISFFDTKDSVIAKDSKGYLYTCTIQGMTPLSDKESFDEKESVELNLFEVIEKIDEYGIQRIYLKDLDLYLDEASEVRGFSEDGIEYRLSGITHLIDKEYEGEGKPKESWKKVTYDKLCKENEDFINRYQQNISYKDLAKLSALHGYIEESKKEESGVFGKDYRFFTNFYGAVYALDELKNAYRCDQDGMIRVKDDELFAGYWPEIDRLEVFNAIRNYVDNKTTINKRKKEIIDLAIFPSYDETLFALSEDQRYYWLPEEEAEFMEINEEEVEGNFSGDGMVDTNVSENVKYHGELRFEKKVFDYTQKYCRRITDEDCELNRFFVKKDKKGNNIVYAMSDIDEEYILTKKSIKEVEEGTIEAEGAQEIDMYLLFLALDGYDIE